MRAVVRTGSMLAFALALALVPAAVGASEDLVKARDLFEHKEYVAAQELLLKVDREALTPDEQTVLDELLAEIPQAVEGSAHAQVALAAGDAAYEAGDWDAAAEQYEAVIANAYASDAARAQAETQQERIAEKQRLAEAAKPSGTVEETLIVETTTESEPQEVAAAPVEPEPIESQRLTPTGQLRMRDELLWQRAVAQAQAKASKAREAMANSDFVEARKLADGALQVIEASRRYAEPVSKYEVAKAEITQLQQMVDQQKREYEASQAARERDEIAKRISARRDQLERQKQESVQQLFNSADQLRREHRFGEAAEVLRQILRIDPSNAKARDQLEVAEDYESFGQQAEWYRDVHYQQRRSLQKAQEALIAWDYDVLYPKNWLELTAQRTSQGALGGQDFEDVEVNRRLDEVLPEVRFVETPFEQVVDFLTESTQTNIAVDWADLDEALVMNVREKPVSVKLNNLKFRVVLQQVLTQVGGEIPLAFAVGDGLLRVATKERLDQNKFIVTYDVRDLLGEIPHAKQPDFGKQQLIAVDGGHGGNTMFGSATNLSNMTGVEAGVTGDTPRVDKLKDILRSVVEPDSWMEAGAGASGGSVQDLNGQLLVYNTSSAHRQVVDLLGMLRETQALQISVEARFLDVVSNFLEEFGVDLDFVFNSGSAGYDRTGLLDPVTQAPVLMPRQYSRIGAYPATPGFGTAIPQGQTPVQPYGGAAFVPANGGISPHISEMTPISASQSSLSLVEPSNISTGVPGSWTQRAGTNPALNIAGSFLDNLQVDFLIRATQANQRSSVVQAPRAVMLNGQAVEIRVETRRDYVASLTPVVGENVGLPQPNVQSINSGISMWVQGVISSDRRYVTLSIALLNQGEPSFESYTVQRASGNSPSIFIQLPTYSRTQFTTTVSIPDGGTVLLGGFKRVGEVELEAGVPILSKIPILKRAFTNNITVKDTQTMLILVKAKIHIQKEAEDEAFPSFTGLGV